MYVGALIMLAGTPLALGPYRGLPAVPFAVVALVARISDEETMLARDLAGYGDYVERTRHRLLPGVW
jgi:protein-S-isoprenylcysteine O-methyltransferase Ste14